MMIQLVILIIPLISSLEYQNLTTHYLNPTDFLRQSIQTSNSNKQLLLSSDSLSIYDPSIMTIKQSILRSQIPGFQNDQWLSIVRYQQSLILMGSQNYAVYNYEDLESLELGSIVRKYPGQYQGSMIQSIRQQGSNIYIGYKDGTIQQHGLEQSNNQTLVLGLESTIKPVQQLLDLQVHTNLMFVSQPTSTQLLILDQNNKNEPVSKTKYGKQGMIQKVEPLNSNVAIIGMGSGMVYIIDHFQSTILGLLSGGTKDVSYISWNQQQRQILQVVVGYYNGCWNYYQFDLVELMDSGKYFKEIKPDISDCSMSGAVKHVSFLQDGQLLLGAKRGMVRIVQVGQKSAEQQTEQQEIKQDL